jgi:hypothetical protein
MPTYEKSHQDMSLSMFKLDVLELLIISFNFFSLSTLTVLDQA